MNSPIRPKIELVHGFMAVLISCYSDEASIKNEIVIVQTLFSDVSKALKFGNSHANSRNKVKIEMIRG